MLFQYSIKSFFFQILDSRNTFFILLFYVLLCEVKINYKIFNFIFRARANTLKQVNLELFCLSESN